MGIRSPFDADSSSSHIVDKMIGNAYPVVRAVYSKLDEITYLVDNTGKILEAGNAALAAMEGYTGPASSDLIGHLAAGTGAVATTIGNKLREWVGVKDFGAKGDGITDDTSAFKAALLAGAGGVVYVPKGTYIIKDTLVMPAGTTLQGEGVGHWRPGTFADFDAYTLEHGSNLVFAGTGPKTYSMDFVTDMRCSGHVYPNPSPEYALDNEFALTDFTNKNAAGATAANLKPFSVAIFCSSLHGNAIKDLRVVVNNPGIGIGETYGVGGYRDPASLSWGCKWDVGIFSASTRCLETHNVQVVGYWRVAALLISPVSYGSNGLSGLAEMGKFYDSIFQGWRGVSIRAGDQWPVLSKSVDSLTTRWTPSHTFAPTGVLRIDGSSVPYTGLIFDAVTSTLTFTGISSTEDIIAGSSLIERTSSQGVANTTFYGCDITDISHHSRIAEYNPVFCNDAKAPGSALEISGQNLRGINFVACSLYVNGPIMGHFGRARNVAFMSCHFETKTNYSAVGVNSGILGCAWLAGGYKGNSDNFPLTGTVDLRFSDTSGDDPRIDRSPLRPGLEGSRLAGSGYFQPNQYTDTTYRANSYPNQWQMNYGTGTWGVLSSSSVPRLVVHDTHVQSAADLRLSNAANRLQLEQTDGAENDKVWEFTNTSGAGTFTLRTATDTYSAGTAAWTAYRDGTAVTNQTWKLSSGTFTFTGGNVKPGTDNEYSLGMASARFSVLYAGTGTIATSDARAKTAEQDIEAAIFRAWAKVNYRQYKFTDAVTLKGTSARWHFGVIAQQVKAAFESEGLDAFAYGLLCYDSWEGAPAVIDQDGIETVAATEAGDRYGIRYEEALALECAYLRSRLE